MFKLVIVSSLLIAAVSALPTILHEAAEQPQTITTIAATPVIAGIRTVLAPETIQIHEPTVAKVGDLLQKIPTSVSHQRQTVVHNHADVITPIVAPAVRTTTSQVLKAYSTPLVYAASAPIIRILRHD